MRLIDVDALLAQMEECYERRAEEANMTGDRAVCVTWNDAVFIIKNAPTVDAVPVRHGKWENTRPDAPMFGFYYCSLCGRKRTSPQDRYCPNCGADMREVGK